MAYSLELRTKALHVYETGTCSQEEIARLLGIGISTLKRWLNKKKKGENLSPPSTRSGRPKKITAAGRQTIKQLVNENPSITLGELSTLYYQHYKIKLSASMLCRELKSLHFSYKKLSLYATQKETDDIKKKERSI